MQRLVADLNRLHTSNPAFHEVDFEWKGFEWLEVNDLERSTLAFIRRAADPNQFVLVVCNFTPVVRVDYRVGAPVDGSYQEFFNSDSAYYGGGDVGNLGGVMAEPIPWNGQQFSLKITLPPLAVVYFELKHE
jgi:1,4-alpha-glucan branching enzyme